MWYTDDIPLGHLSSAKLGATEQRWAAQLVSFDFEIKCNSEKSNRNADALSRQHSPGVQDLKAMLLGNPLPKPLQPVMAEVAQATVVTLPYCPLDIQALQEVYPVIQKVLDFWKQG